MSLQSNIKVSASQRLRGLLLKKGVDSIAEWARGKGHSRQTVYLLCCGEGWDAAAATKFGKCRRDLARIGATRDYLFGDGQEGAA